MSHLSILVKAWSDLGNLKTIPSKRLGWSQKSNCFYCLILRKYLIINDFDIKGTLSQDVQNTVSCAEILNVLLRKKLNKGCYIHSGYKRPMKGKKGL
jgi:hypothetical protein